MNMHVSIIVLCIVAFCSVSQSQTQTDATSMDLKVDPKGQPAVLNVEESSALDELNPFSRDIESQLLELDYQYKKATDKHAWPQGFDPLSRVERSGGCFRGSCKVYAHVRKSDQKLYLFVDGNPTAEWSVSTGALGFETPNFDRHPNGRIYDAYMSSTFPGGDYQGLGNMPYAVFIEGGFAVHGTAKSNWKYLGRRASHGCVRLHPDNALTFNRLVRQYGVANVWIQVD